MRYFRLESWMFFIIVVSLLVGLNIYNTINKNIMNNVTYKVKIEDFKTSIYIINI